MSIQVYRFRRNTAVYSAQIHTGKAAFVICNRMVISPNFSSGCVTLVFDCLHTQRLFVYVMAS